MVPPGRSAPPPLSASPSDATAMRRIRRIRLGNVVTATSVKHILRRCGVSVILASSGLSLPGGGGALTGVV